MPATLQGNASRNAPTAGTWVALTAFTQGQIISPHLANGLAIVAVTSGTTGSTQPSWLTPPFPTIGTQFTDGTVTWMILGFNPGPWPIITQVPVDTDPPLAFSQVISDQQISDQLAWLEANAGLLASENNWTGPNIFNNTIVLNAYDDLDAGIEGLVNPGTGLVLISQYETQNTSFRTYASQYGQFVTVNAKWTGTEWEYDDSTQAAALYAITAVGIVAETYPAASTTPWATGAWGSKVLLDMPSDSLQFAIPISTSQALTVNSTLQAAIGVLTTAQIGIVSQVNGIYTVGQYGVATPVNDTGVTTGGSGAAPVALSSAGGGTALIGTASARFAGIAGWYRMTVWANSTTIADDAYPPTLTIGWSYGTADQATMHIAMGLDGVDAISGAPYFSYTTMIRNPLGGGISCNVYTLPGTGPYTGWAMLEAIY